MNILYFVKVKYYNGINWTIPASNYKDAEDISKRWSRYSCVMEVYFAPNGYDSYYQHRVYFKKYERIA